MEKLVNILSQLPNWHLPIAMFLPFATSLWNEILPKSRPRTKLCRLPKIFDSSPSPVEKTIRWRSKPTTAKMVRATMIFRPVHESFRGDVGTTVYSVMAFNRTNTFLVKLPSWDPIFGCHRVPCWFKRARVVLCYRYDTREKNSFWNSESCADGVFLKLLR